AVPALPVIAAVRETLALVVALTGRQREGDGCGPGRLVLGVAGVLGHQRVAADRDVEPLAGQPAADLGRGLGAPVEEEHDLARHGWVGGAEPALAPGALAAAAALRRAVALARALAVRPALPGLRRPRVGDRVQRGDPRGHHYRLA